VSFKHQLEGLIRMGNSILQQWEEAAVNFNSHHTSSFSHYPEHRFSVFWYWIHVGSNKNKFKGTKLNTSLQKQTKIKSMFSHLFLWVHLHYHCHY